MGKCYIKPIVQKEYERPPKLEWSKIIHSNEHAGDILASFELLLVIILTNFILEINLLVLTFF